MSWQFEGAPPLAISIEARRERGETYHPVPALYRQYELYYAIADERDLLEVRVRQRGERVWRYPLRTSPEDSRALLLSYLEEMQVLSTSPAWYHATLRNCSTSTASHARAIGIEGTWDWRVLLNGHVDELLYEHGALDTSRPFEQLRAASEVTARIGALPLHDPRFSEHLRR